MGGSVGIICLLPTSRHMTSTDRNDLTTYRNDLMPAQEKLEWVTPKISLIGSGDTDGTGKSTFLPEEVGTLNFGPS
jgi:hypothetical protein